MSLGFSSAHVEAVFVAVRAGSKQGVEHLANAVISNEQNSIVWRRNKKGRKTPASTWVHIPPSMARFKYQLQILPRSDL